MTEQTIVFITIGSVVAMLLLGGIIITSNMFIRRRVLLRRRMAQIGVIGGGASNASERGETRRQRRIQDKLKNLDKNKEKKGVGDGIREKIMQAGLDISVNAYWVGSLCVGVSVALFYLVMLKPVGLSAFVGVTAAFLVGALGLPDVVLKFIAKRRQKKFTEGFPDAVDLIVRGVRSGLPINECFSVVAREFEAPLGEEFRLIVEGQNLGLTLEDLMDRGLKRVPTSEYKFFAIVTQIQKQTGGNLGDTLSNLSSVLRERKKMKAKVQSMSSEAKSSAAIIGSLPFLVAGFLSVVNPEYLMLLFTDSMGHWMLGIGAFWLACGIAVMHNMINFKI
jgi:tight adherence protein B